MVRDLPQGRQLIQGRSLPRQSNIFDIEFPKHSCEVDVRIVVEGRDLNTETIDSLAGSSDVEQDFRVGCFTHRRRRKYQEKMDANDGRKCG